MIGKKQPGKAFGSCLYQQVGKAIRKRLPVIIIKKNIPMFNSSDFLWDKVNASP
jgi:hypothetical protein